ncbi:hypothetical protein V2J09_007268 [Rumex salicifolius]
MATIKSSIYQPLLLTTTTLYILLFLSATTNAAPGRWKLLQSSIGVSAMHMQLLPSDRVVIFDRTNFGPSNLSLPAGKCRKNPLDRVLKTDCTAHSAEYNPISNTFRALNIFSDTWCSSGALLPDGTLAQSGGSFEGERVVRTLVPCQDNSCDWKELGKLLIVPRWYASNHRLPNGQMIIVGGRKQFNYEFYPKTTSTNTNPNLPFLSQTNDAAVENNLYPFVFLNVDGNLFIFANNRAILLNYKTNTVVKTYPTILGGDPRSYPSTGSAVLLPLKNLDSGSVQAEVLVCGGAPKGSYLSALKKTFVTALNTCARIKITDPNPHWSMETMPMARAMGDMVLLPTGRVLIVNGVGAGTAGWELGRNAVLNPVVYDPEAAVNSRFEIQTASKIPRVYHSTAILLRDARVLVGGSNAHSGYSFTNVLFPTQLSLEAFSPSYFDVSKTTLRPKIVSPTSSSVTVKFSVTGKVDVSKVKVTMIAPSFATHSFSQGQRMLVLTLVGNVKDLPSAGVWVIGLYQSYPAIF